MLFVRVRLRVREPQSGYFEINMFTAGDGERY